MKNDWNEIEKVMQELIDHQKSQLLTTGRKVVSTLTPEDVLQPNDYPELEQCPYFRYEEGIVAGAQMIQIALGALKNEKSI